jgi:DNA (cytosine-5)-methyltransferase 1
MNKLFETEKNNFIDTKCKMDKTEKYSVVSLFSGCGGIDFGFKGGFNYLNKFYEKNNFDLIFANDIDKSACETYFHNFGHSPLNKDIREVKLDEIPKADIVLGGFPCQDFSLSGKRKGLNSQRGQLYLEMKRIVDYLKPKIFVAENVDGIRTSKHDDGSALEKILNDFRSIGYNVKYEVLNAADYEVPQTRIRVIIIGLRNDINSEIFFPKSILSENCKTNPWISSKIAIDDLWDKLDSSHINNHTTRDYSKAKFYPGKKMQGNYQIKAHKPSVTIRAEHHGNIEAHYRTNNLKDPENMNYWRRLSVRECARLQSFPDTFDYPVSVSKAYKQIGNAVPPVLGWHIARAVYYTLINQK